MSIGFNADDILSIAEQIERNGARFYRAAAELPCDPETKPIHWPSGEKKGFCGFSSVPAISLASHSAIERK